MSSQKRKNRSKGRKDGQSTPALDQSSAATQDAQQPMPFGDGDNPDMSRSNDLDSDSAQVGNPVPLEAAQIDFRPMEPSPPAHAQQRESLGQRLRAAREARGWSGADVAARLHLPIQIVQTLEADRFEAIGHRIYLRGYLTNYLRLLDLPTILVETVLQQHNDPPPLTTSGTISHSRYLFQRYSVSALYLILTGVIIVPAVMLAMRAGLEPKIAELTNLDSPAAVATDAAKSNASPAATTSTPAASSPSETAAAPSAPSAAAPSDSPLIASMAPFQALGHKDSDVPQPPPSVSGSGAHTLRLSLKEASWVEVTSVSGEKLEYGLLPAGTVRTISSDSVLDVRIGNSSGAEVELDGQTQDLTAYRHSNVAHFKAFASGKTISSY